MCCVPDYVLCVSAGGLQLSGPRVQWIVMGSAADNTGTTISHLTQLNCKQPFWGCRSPLSSSASSTLPAPLLQYCDNCLFSVLATTNSTERDAIESALSGTIGISPLVDTTTTKFQDFEDLWQNQVALLPLSQSFESFESCRT